MLQVAFVALLLAATCTIAEGAENRDAVDPDTLKVGETLEVTDDQPACLDYGNMMRLQEFMGKDMEAAQKLFDAGVRTGRCKMLKAGLHVEAEQTYLPFYKCVRPRGEVLCLFVSYRHLKRPPK